MIAALQARYAEQTGCRTLRIKHNNLLGYFIEVPQSVGEACLKGLQGEFVHRQTMVDAMRFTSVELAELEAADLGRGRPGARAGARRCSTDLAAAVAGRGRGRSRDGGRGAGRARRRRRATANSPSSCDWRRPVVDDSLSFRRRGRAPSGGRGGAAPGGRAVHRQRLRPLGARRRAGRRHPADHRPQHGRQVDLPAPERADRRAGPDGRLRAGRRGADRRRRPAVLPRRRRRRPRPRAARPSWSRWSRPPRS